MESPLQEQRNCPACPSGIIAPTDLHLLCFECLGMEHAIAGLERRPACPCCRYIPCVRRQQRADFLSPDASDEEKREDEEDAMEEEDAAPTYTTTIPDEALPTGPASAFVAGLIKLAAVE